MAKGINLLGCFKFFSYFHVYSHFLSIQNVVTQALFKGVFKWECVCLWTCVCVFEFLNVWIIVSFNLKLYIWLRV